MTQLAAISKQDTFNMEKHAKTYLKRLKANVPWQSLALLINKHLKRGPQYKIKKVGRPSVDGLIMMKMFILQVLHNISDDEAEYQSQYRLDFRWFLDLGETDKAPDAKTLWLFKEELIKEELYDAVVEMVSHALTAAGYMAREGQIIDAQIIKMPTSRNAHA